MEKPETELEVFSALSLLEYVRLMTAAHYIEKGKDAGAARFKISSENFEKASSLLIILFIIILLKMPIL